MWQRIFALTIKEFLALLRDPKARLVIIVPPIVQLILFSFAATYDVNHVSLAVFDRDGGHDAGELIADFVDSPHFTLVGQIHRQADIATLIDRQEALVVLSVGPRFAHDLRSPAGAQVQLIVDGRNSNTAAIVQGYASDIIGRYNQQWLRSHDDAIPSELVTRAWFNPNLESRWFIVPGIVGLLVVVVVLVVTALSVAREREQGTFDQLLVTPMRPTEILIGKAVPGLVIGLLEATAIIVISMVVFGIPLRGEIATLYVGLVLFLLSSVGVGLMISALSATLQQAVLGAFLFLVPAVILSGFATPIANMPPLVQDLTLINPLRYFMVVVRGVFLEGTPLHLLVHQFWPMAVIGVVTLMLAGWLFRHRMY
ncbi:MAG TPA: ABC transporter permease [Guyparkeria sp.]|nr:ABC transporter permease [Guyparkeria sp.]